MSILPIGTVTFLLTDIEGSTALWEQHPDAMRVACVRHDELVENIVRQWNGVLVRPRGEGDGRFAVFPFPTDAVAAATALQRALYAEQWPKAILIRVRMALHTGEADLRDGDYYGSAVNRCARLRSIAHGGQTLISQATYELVRDDPPAGITLKDMGSHRLKDLTRPEQVFHLVGSDLPEAFPPLKSLDARPHNLPIQPTPYIGRETKIHEVRSRLIREDVRLLTLTGPGGIGKTRLGLQAAADLLDVFEDGIFFVDLSPMTDPELVVSAIVRVLGVTEANGLPLSESLKEYLHHKQILLLLDNFEQVLDAAPLISDLLSAAPRLKVLVTSRAVLQLHEEYTYPVPSLSLPDRQRLPPIEQITQYEAIQLFIERSQAVKPDFTVTNDTAPAVAQICIHLDGIPLAIELAASRTKLFTPHALLSRLENRLQLLTGGPRNAPARHRTLRAAIDWSYHLLDEDEQTLFRRLTVFADGFTLEAIEAMALEAENGEFDPLEGITSLLDKGMIHRLGGEETRFSMLETLREYGRERLVAQGEEERMRRQHAEYFLRFAEEMAVRLMSSERPAALHRIDKDYENIQSALLYFRSSGEREEDQRFVASLWRYWDYRGMLREARDHFRAALSGEKTRTATRQSALYGAACISQRLIDYAATTEYANESLVIAQAMEDSKGMGDVYRILGDIAGEQGRREESLSYLEKMKAISERLDDKVNLAFAYFQIAYAKGPVSEESRVLYENSYRISVEIGDRLGQANCMNMLAYIALERGDTGSARAYWTKVLQIGREEGMPKAVAWSFQGLGRVAYREGDHETAEANAYQALELYWKRGDLWEIVGILGDFAQDARSRGEPARAARIYGAGEAQREAIGIPHPDKEAFASARSSLQPQLGEAEIDKLWQEGRSWSLEQAVLYALGTKDVLE
jgi:predicted ATPase/class 3 adenylate cyclase